MSRVVRILAGKLHARLPHDSGIEISDLVQAGNVGLLKASKSYRPERGAPLAGYAKFRIRGEMLDVIRESARHARVVCTATGAEEDLTELDARLPASHESSPQSCLLRRQRDCIIGEEIKRLPRRYRTVVRLRYEGEMTLRQIGDALSVNESRACQIHRNALSLLRRALKNRGVGESSQF